VVNKPGLPASSDRTLETALSSARETPVVMELVTDPAELARARAQDQRFERNLAWFRAHAAELYASHRGQCLCIAGGEAFAADSAAAALALAGTAHPDDDGRFTIYVPRRTMDRVYAHRGTPAPLP
jgi:hypothetical protein